MHTRKKMTAKTVAVLGAGCSGLTAVKSCVEEGLQPVCFEKSDNIGGLWRFTESVREGEGCVARTTVIDTSKEIMSYSDFPIPAEFPNYLHNTKVWEYFNMYADHFGLKKYIRFNTEVVSVEPIGDTGRWKVTTKEKGTGNAMTSEFDAVMICVGHHAHPIRPALPGLDQFEGDVIHTRDFKDSYPFSGKNVVVVGIGNSGIDATADLSRVTKQTFLSTRRGAWIRTKLDPSGYPSDLGFSRKNEIVSKWFPNYFDRKMEQALNKRFDHKLYGLQPTHGIRAVHPTIQDDLPGRILTGAVKVKPDIKTINQKSIEFQDSTVEDVDAILLATGYRFSFSFLDKSILNVEKNEADLYMHMFPVTLGKPTLAAIGYFQPIGAIMPISELQSRWATRVFKGLSSVPDNATMMADVLKKRAYVQKTYVASTRHTMQVDFIPFMDELASKFGVKPKLARRMITDPKLWWRIVFGPIVSYQYRLDGPGKWPGARDAVMSVYDRVRRPFELNRRVPTLPRGSGGKKAAAAAILLTLSITGAKTILHKE